MFKIYQKLGDNRRRFSTLLMFTILSAMVLVYFVTAERQSWAVIEVTSDAPTTLRIYWAATAGAYTQEHSSRVVITSGHGCYRLPLENLRRFPWLRIDPLEQAGTITIKQLQLHIPGIAPLALTDQSGLQRLQPGNHIAACEYRQSGLVVTANGKDPYLLLPYRPGDYGGAWAEIEMSSDGPGNCKLYWASAGQEFGENQAATVAVNQGRHCYRLPLGPLASICGLRFDPLDRPGQVTIHRLILGQQGYPQRSLSTAEQLAGFRAINHITSQKIDSQGLHLSCSGNDPYLAIALPPVATSRIKAMLWLAGILGKSLVAALAIWWLIGQCRRFDVRKALDHKYLITTALAFILALILAMAIVSPYKSLAYFGHPDEYVHYPSARYYAEHWLPPQPENPAIRDSYSIYGLSRLNKPTWCYFTAGKFMALVANLVHRPIVAARLFNVALFAILLALAIANHANARILALLVISPQVWYVYSYINGDAFPLTLCLLLAQQLAIPGSRLNRFLNSGSLWQGMSGAWFFGILIGMLLVGKRNYLAFVAFSAGALTLQLLLQRHSWRRLLPKYLVIAAICLLVAGMRHGIDRIVRPNLLSRYLKMQKQLANPDHLVNADPQQLHFGLHLRQKGVQLTELFSDPWQWHRKTFRSFVGQYGYLNLAAADWYYWLMLLLYGLLFGYVLIAGMIYGSWQLRLLGGLGLGLASVLTAMAIYYSWALDFQAQGRYLFPIIPMLMVYLAHGEAIWNRAWIAWLLAALFGLSAYSFCFTGLALLA